MNELKLIESIRKKTPLGPEVLVGIGDDAAVIRPKKKGHDWLLKSDMVLEGTHFDSKRSRPRQWGYKAVMCNVSDIAAMGGVPRFCVVSVGLPKKASLKLGYSIYDGIRDACRKFRIQVVGGDTCAARGVVISVFMMGEVESGRAIQRQGALKGDVLFVTGPLGGSLKSGRHLSFTPRVEESRFLAKNYRVHAMLDVSDGLAKDLRHLAQMSKIGIKVYDEAIPLNRNVRHVESAYLDGEDFELVFSLSAKEASRLLKDRRLKRKGFTFYPIGRVVQSKEGLKRIERDGTARAFPKIKDHHF